MEEYGLELVTAPTVEPVTLAQARAWLRLRETGPEDEEIEDLITAARVLIEAEWSVRLVNSTWRLTMEGFPGCGPIRIPIGPLVSVSSIQYVDGAGATQTLGSSHYTVDTSVNPGEITAAYGEAWPVTRCQPRAVLVTFVAGHGATAASVPRTLQLAVKMAVNWWFERRGDERESAGTALPEVCRRLVMAHWSGRYA